MLSGALNADGGTVAVRGRRRHAVPAYKRARMGIGRTHQIPRPFRQMTVFENLLVARHYGGRSESDLGVHADCEAILHDLGLSSVAHTKAADLTLLQLKRLELARALALEPRILLMDEIGAGLVESEILELIEVIKALRHRVEAIVIIEHIMDVITRVLRQGRGARLRPPDRRRPRPEGPRRARGRLLLSRHRLRGARAARHAAQGQGGRAPDPRDRPRVGRLRPLPGAHRHHASTCTRARSWRCSAPTAPARRPRRASSAA